MEQDLGGAFITWTRSPEGPRDEGTGGQGIPSSEAKRSCSSPGKPFPGAQGEGKPLVGHSKPSTPTVSPEGWEALLQKDFPFLVSPQNHWSQARNWLWLCWELQTLADQAAGVRSWVWIRPWLVGRTTPGEWRGAMN